MQNQAKARDELRSSSAPAQSFPLPTTSETFHQASGSRDCEAIPSLFEERYELAFRCSPDPITITTIGEGRYVDVNTAFLEVSGYERHEVIGHTAIELDIWLSPQERDIFIQEFRSQNYYVRNQEIRFRTKSGEIRTFIFSSELIYIKGIPHLLWVTKDISERKSLEEALRIAGDRYSKAFVMSPDPIMMCRLSDHRYVEANHAWLSLIGYRREEIIGRSATEMNLWVDGEREQLVIQVREFGSIRNKETRFYTRSGNIIYCLFSAEIIEINGIEYLLSITKDISDRKRMEDAIRQSEEKFSRAFNNSSVSMSITTLKEGRFIELNEISRSVLGHDRDDVLGRTSFDIDFWVNPQDRQKVVDKIMSQEKVRDYQILFRSKSGEQRLGSYSAEGIEINGEPCMLNILVDITEQKKAEAEIIYLSFHDKLTGLYNRAYFEEELKRTSNLDVLPMSLILGDVNGLKLINDAMGHAEGDRLLRTVAKILTQSCRAQDTVARWGGDEFIILLPDCTSKTASQIVERIQEQCRQFSQLPIQISLSLGLSTRKFMYQDIRSMVQEAEDKMYRNKLLIDKSIRSSFLVSLQQTLWSRSHETEEHCLRLQSMVHEIGQAAGLPQSELDNLRLLSLLHDIGKIAIPSSILDKPGQLNAEEWDTIKKHPEIGYRIALSSPEMAPIAEAILHHHERWDGSGYPLGIKGKEIPLISRIIAIADAYDVMIYGRPYQEARSEAEVWEEIKRCAGSQFDPYLVDKSIALFGL